MRRSVAAIGGVAVLGLVLGALAVSGKLGSKPAPHALVARRAPKPVVDASVLAATWGEPAEAADAWLPFEPATDDFAPAELDLRMLNDARAGDTGPLAASGEKLVRSGKQERLFGVNARERVLLLSDAAMSAFARGLAKRGVNLVRLHLRYWSDDDLRKVDPKRLERTHRLVAELAREGISFALSIFFPYWLKPRPEEIPGYDGNTRAFGLLYSDPGFRDIYRGWWRQILTPRNPYTGRSLAEDPALALVELVNEDSTLFWTFETYGRLPPPQTREVERAFGRFLAERYGSVRAGLDRFGGGPVRGDAPEEERAGVLDLATITRTTTARTRETAEFLARYQRDIYAELQSYLTGELGLRALVVCSNWVTASGRLLGPLDKWSNGACDVMDQHGYFSGPHTGKEAWYRIAAGQRFDDRSALLLDGEPATSGPHELPTHAVRWQGKPGIVSELGWPSPNRFRAELPLLVLAYGSLQGTSGFALFTTESPGYDTALTKFGIADPALLGQFPGVALAYRRGYLAEGKVVASARPSLPDLFALRGGPLGKSTIGDALRSPDAAAAPADSDAGRIDPFALFVGKVEVSASEHGAPTALADLTPYVDRGTRLVRSSTGEVSLDFAHGVLRVNAPRVQGVAGFLGAESPLELSVLRVEAGLEYGAVLAVSLDGEPLASSRRILLQVASELENTGFSAPGTGVRTIADPGRGPLRMRRIDARVTLKRPDFEGLHAVALDPNGRALRAAKTLAGGLALLPGAVYYIVTAP